MLFFRQTKQISKNIADTPFKRNTKLRGTNDFIYVFWYCESYQKSDADSWHSWHDIIDSCMFGQDLRKIDLDKKNVYMKKKEFNLGVAAEL